MISELRIENLGVISSARVRLGPGLTAITGETGAGKTMLLTGLALLLGGKPDSAAVRSGADQAVAEGSFGVDPASPAAIRAEEAGAELDEGVLVALRTVAAAGRSRAFLGGRSVPQGVLAELAEHLVTVHGQADQARLRSPRRQREALDAFAGPEHAQTLSAYRDAWSERQRLTGELDDLVSHAAERTREAELLRVGLAEVERVNPKPGEDVRLASESERLGHAEDLRAAAFAAHAALAGVEDAGNPPGAVEQIERARRTLEQASAHDDALAELAGRLAEAGYLLADLGADLARYADQVQAEPGRLAAVHDRRAELTALTRVHAGDVDQVLVWASEAGLRLLELEQGEDRTSGLRAAITELDARLTRLAEALGTQRSDAAKELSAIVTSELAGLAMPAARLDVQVTSLPELGPWGGQDVAFLLTAHAGAPALPLGQGASGGELSRVMLAIEVALATRGSAQLPPTFVFDEVDAGVGGKAAVEVGRRLAQLARQAQVVVVTHLPQVAAFADQHVVVRKSHTGGVITASDVATVTGQDRISELARMLSGQEESTTALKHAAELLERSVVER